MLPPTSDTSLPPASDAWPAGQRFVQAPPQLTGGAALPKVALPNALGSGDHTPMSEAETMQWNSQDWKWDPYAMRAMAAPHDAKTLGNNKQASTAGVEPPTSSSVQASQPAKLPSLAMSSGSRSKSHPTCQVATCETDLTPLKEYHQRYKICEFHLKVHSIVREGKRQRFCQQCGRFHDLTEFDGDKRSCRARLQRHNARRRKKTEADAANKAAAVPKKPTPPAKAPQRIEKRPADSEGRPYRDGMTGSEAMELDESFALLPDGSKHADSEGLQDGSGESSGAGASELYSRRPRSLPAPLFEDGMHGPLLDQQGSVYSSRAPPSYLLQSERQIAGMPYTAPFPGRSATPSQFPADYLGRAGAGLPQGSATLLAGLAEQGFGSRPMELGGFQRATGPRGASVPMPANEALLSHFSMGEPQASILNEARRIMQTPPESYISDEQLTRVSAKLFNCTPANLPLDMKQNLIHLLGRGINSMEGYIRPGCVHLTLNAVSDAPSQDDEQASGTDIRAVVERLHATNASLLQTEQMLIQVNEEIALVKNRRVQHVLSCTGSHAVFPLIARVSSQVTCSTANPVIKLYGANISHPHNTFLCRCQGCWVPCEVVGSNSAAAANSGSGVEQTVELRFGAGLRNGVMHVEVMRGGMMSTAKPILVLDSAHAVQDIQHLQQHMPDGEVEALLLDLDRLLEMRNAATVMARLGSELTRQYSDTDLQLAVSLAHKVLRFATAHACIGLAAYVFPVAFCPQLAAPSQPDHMSLLHLAVRSGSLQMVASLLEWGSVSRTEFHASAAGPQGVTPMHLAALFEEDGALSGRMVALLAELCEDGAEAWEAAANDGSTPAALAAAVGNAEAAQAILESLQAVEEQAGDFEDDGWPVDSATGDALMVDEVSAEAMTVEEVSAETIAASGGSEEDEAVRTSIDSLDSIGSLHETPTAEPAPYITPASASCNAALNQRTAWISPPDAQQYYAKPDASVTVCHAGSHDLGFKIKDHDKFLGHTVEGLQVMPTVFGHTEALLSAVFIATIGAATLSVRWYFEYLCPDRAV